MLNVVSLLRSLLRDGFGLNGVSDYRVMGSLVIECFSERLG